MRRIFIYALVAALIPATAGAQTTPPDELSELLPADVCAELERRVEEAEARGLSGNAIAALAREGVAKGRNGEEVLAAVEALVGDMTRAREALTRRSTTPDAADLEAATAAMRMGVGDRTIRELAAQAPGRPLAVPLVVVGSLVERGLASDEALSVVLARLDAGASDGALLEEPSPLARPLDEEMGGSHGDMAMQQRLALARMIAGVPLSVPSVWRRPGEL